VETAWTACRAPTIRLSVLLKLVNGIGVRRSLILRDSSPECQMCEDETLNLFFEAELFTTILTSRGS